MRQLPPSIADAPAALAGSQNPPIEDHVAASRVYRRGGNGDLAAATLVLLCNLVGQHGLLLLGEPQQLAPFCSASQRSRGLQLAGRGDNSTVISPGAIEGTLAL